MPGKPKKRRSLLSDLAWGAGIGGLGGAGLGGLAGYGMASVSPEAAVRRAKDATPPGSKLSDYDIKGIREYVDYMNKNKGVVTAMGAIPGGLAGAGLGGGVGLLRYLLG